MAELIYVVNVSLDGYIEDVDGNFAWTEPDDEVFAGITDMVRPVGTYLLGRRLYETMAVWETDPTLGAQSELLAEFAEVWQAADKIVYSSTLHSVPTARTRIERHFDPDAVRAMKASASSDLTVGGATLAAQAFRSGLVDECRLLVYPVLFVGAGRRSPSTCASTWTWSRSIGSTTESSTSATASRAEPRAGVAPGQPTSATGSGADSSSAACSGFTMLMRTPVPSSNPATVVSLGTMWTCQW